MFLSKELIMATEWETKMSVAIANLETEVEKVKKTIRNATELRYSPYRYSNHTSTSKTVKHL